MKVTPRKLTEYIKAVEILAIRKNFDRVVAVNKGGSEVSFRLYQKSKDTVPCSIWILHTEHSKLRRVYSKEAYEKAANRLGSTLEEFLAIFDEI